MRILIAPDKFAGSLSAAQVAQTLADVLREHSAHPEIDLCPIADGGEGTAEAIVTAQSGAWVACETVDAQGRPLVAKYGLLSGPHGDEAVIEMSAASGLALVRDRPLDPTTASTYGTGLLLRDAMRRGVQRILIGIGGSATNDGGTGLARALGFRFHAAADSQPGSVGADLALLPRDLDQLDRISTPQHGVGDSRDTRPPCGVVVACDVTNPLLGPEGCTRVFGAQKGVQDPVYFERRLERLVQIVERDLGVRAATVPGAGAAGGLGYGLLVFCGATLRPGFDLIADLIDLRRRVEAADFIITGEGRLDAQTLYGKGPQGIARLARQQRKPVVVIAGQIEDREALTPHFDALIQIKPAAMAVAEAMQRSRELLAASCRNELMPLLTDRRLRR